MTGDFAGKSKVVGADLEIVIEEIILRVRVIILIAQIVVIEVLVNFLVQLVQIGLAALDQLLIEFFTALVRTENVIPVVDALAFNFEAALGANAEIHDDQNSCRGHQARSTFSLVPEASRTLSSSGKTPPTLQ
jgi:hypothetical protein